MRKRNKNNCQATVGHVLAKVLGGPEMGTMAEMDQH